MTSTQKTSEIKIIPKPLVSICCFTYNHSKYIKDALDGFLSQKCDFPFEIMVHDDASTDGTREILVEYEKKHPGKIFVKYQPENLYSQKKYVEMYSFLNLARGRYIAFCEGDDYWIDENKLSLQVSALEKHGDIGICVHPALMKSSSGEKKDTLVGDIQHLVDELGVVSLNGMTSHESLMCPNSSVLVRREKLFEYMLFMEYNPTLPVGDAFLRFIASSRNGAAYINKVMSVYRYETETSWSKKQKENTEFDKIFFYKNMISSYDALDVFLKGEYREQIENMKSIFLYHIIISKNEYRNMLFMELALKSIETYAKSSFVNFAVYGAGAFFDYFKTMFFGIDIVVDRDIGKQGKEFIKNKKIDTLEKLECIKNYFILVTPLYRKVEVDDLLKGIPQGNTIVYLEDLIDYKILSKIYNMSP